MLKFRRFMSCRTRNETVFLFVVSERTEFERQLFNEQLENL